MSSSGGIELSNVNRKGSVAATVTDDPVDQAREILKTKCPINFSTFGFEFKFQLYVLIVTTVLFWIGVLMTALAMNDIKPENLPEPLESFADNIYQTFDGEIIIEFVCLIFGWCTIFTLPGLSVLRCFRVFRYFWYFELFSQDEGNFVYRMIVKSVQLVIESLEKIGAELLTTKSRGGLVVLTLFFFVSYLFAVVFHTCMGHLNTIEGETCSTLYNCFIIMLRLSFYDGTGFDYMNALVDQGYSGFAFLIIIYMCFSAMILLNGLIGIFGIAFQGDEEGDSDDEKPKQIDDANDINKPIATKRLPDASVIADIQLTIKELKSDIKAVKRNIDELKPILDNSKRINKKF
eukprot:gene19582-25485_t